MAKNEARAKNWKFVLVKFGKVLVKKEENGKVIYITKERDTSLIQ